MIRIVKRIVLLSILFSLFVLSSCIKNDIPYPIVRLQILQFEVEGQLGSSVINTNDRTVTLSLSEEVDIQKVPLKKISVTEGAQSTLTPLDTIDLSVPYLASLSLYQTYNWMIIAVQEIARFFVVEDEIGVSLFDVASHTVTVHVGKNHDLEHIQITRMKLGPEGATYSRTMEQLSGSFKDGSKTVDVTYHGRTETWTISVIQVEKEVFTEPADAWTKVAWLKGLGKKNLPKSFEYRESGDLKWQKVTTEIIDKDGSFSTRLSGLKPLTTYEYRAQSGENYGEIVSFKTATATPITDGGFDYWHEGRYGLKKVWNPWKEGSNSFWDTGNQGAATLGKILTSPIEDPCEVNPTGKAAKLESDFIGVWGIGKFAPGNLFVGEYLRTVGTDGVVNFGRPYSSFPTKATIYYKYTPQPINYVADELKGIVHENNPDTCQIFVALGDWDNPVEIRTAKNDRKLFDPKDPNIIAYASFQSGDPMPAYQKLELELKYRSTNRTPKFLVMVCTASKYGDYFTGGSGSLLIVDELSVTFD
ncbi:MAG: PCMD domain-containing protein [Phocaeicola sp.]